MGLLSIISAATGEEPHVGESPEASQPDTDNAAESHSPTRDATLEFALGLIRIMKVHVHSRNCKHCRKIIEETFAMAEPSPAVGHSSTKPAMGA